MWMSVARSRTAWEMIWLTRLTTPASSARRFASPSSSSSKPGTSPTSSTTLSISRLTLRDPWTRSYCDSRTFSSSCSVPSRIVSSRSEREAMRRR